MTKTFKITIGILILLALAAGGVLGISRSKQPSSALTGQGTPSSAPSARFGGQAVDKEEGNEEVEEITAGDIDTSNWKTYRNEEYGFELKYPGEWEVETWEGVNLFVYYNTQKEEKEKIKKAIAIHSAGWRDNVPEGGGSFVIYNLNIKSEEFIKKYNSDDDKISQINNESKKELLNDKKVSHITAGTAIGLDKEYLIFEEDLKNSFIISFDEFDHFHKQILSTFHFLN